MKNYEKIKKLKFLDFALVTDDVIIYVKIFETCDQFIFITYSLKIKHIKFHGFSMKRTGFMVIFLPRTKKLPPPHLRSSKNPAWDRINQRKDVFNFIEFSYISSLLEALDIIA